MKSIIPHEQTRERLRQDALHWIDENEKRVVEVSDELWEYAELGFIEHRSAKLLSDELERHGFRLERGVAGYQPLSSPRGAPVSQL